MFNKCLTTSQQLNAVQMQLECILCLAYIAFDAQNWDEAKEHFDHAYEVSDFRRSLGSDRDCNDLLFAVKQVAKKSGDNYIAEQCLCNAGIALGNGTMEQEQRFNQTFYNRQEQVDNNSGDDEEVKGEDLVAITEVPDYQKNVIGQATFYGGGFGNINQEDWSDDEDEDEDDEEDLEVEELR